MSKQNIKVFISSTFRDLDVERSYLVQVVFPLIREQLVNKTVSEVDLRWGITDEESRNKRVVDLCLQYLYESKPFFVGILGKRYGSILKPENVDLSPLVEDVFPNVWQDINQGLSITEIEILNGVLRAPEGKRPKAIFFIMDSDKPYEGEDYTKFQKLQALKKRIKEQNIYPVYSLNELQDLDKVKSFILDALKEENETTNSRNNNSQTLFDQTIQKQWKSHQDMLASYREHEPDNYTVLDNLMPALERAKPLVILEGMQGIGKSTLVAQLGAKYKKNDRLFIHLYGNVPNIALEGFSFISFFIAAAKHILQDRYNTDASKKNLKGWFTRNFLNFDLDNWGMLMLLIQNRTWCFVLDNVNTLRLQTLSPMLKVVSCIINGIANFEKQYSISIDYRILVVQTENSIYSMANNEFEKVTIPCDGIFNPQHFVKEYLSGYTKHITQGQLYTLTANNMAGHFQSLYMVCEYMRESVSHEQISEFINKVASFRGYYDVYKLFIERLQSEFDSASIKRLAGLISLFSYGPTLSHLQELSGMSNFDFHRAWTSFSKLTTEEPTGAVHWINTSVATAMDELLQLRDESFRTSLAKECKAYYFKKVNDLFTPEKLQAQINKAWWFWKSDLIVSLPNRDKSILELRQLDDLGLLSYLQRNKCFSYEHIRKYVYPYVMQRNWSQQFSNAFKKAKEDAKRKGEGTGFKDIASKAYSFMDEEACKQLYRLRMPSPIELFCYLEALRISKQWKQLEVELANPEVLNYIWDTSIIADCWQVAMKEANISIIQPDMKKYDKMLLIAHVLRNEEGIKYYSEAQKITNIINN